MRLACNLKFLGGILVTLIFGVVMVTRLSSTSTPKSIASQSRGPLLLPLLPLLS